MSSGSEEDQGAARKRAGAGDRTTCTPCRGTGQVTSNLGGQTHQVTCPWCRGSGHFLTGRDAQEHPAETG